MIPNPLYFEIGKGVIAVNEYGLDTMFIVIGEKKAAVIDTGMGYCDFKGIIEKITSLPILVLLTHAHQDHCGGMDQFEEVYLHPLDWERAVKVTRESRIRSANRMKGLEGGADIWGYDDSYAREWKKLPKFLPLDDGMEFDLGGRKLKTLFTPGHSEGSCCFIDDKTRILFSGDACNHHLMVKDCSVEREYNSMLHLKEHQHEFDRNFNGHVGFSSKIDWISMPESTLDDILEACRILMEGKETGVRTWPSRLYPGTMDAEFHYGAVWITYNPAMKFIREERK